MNQNKMNKKELKYKTELIIRKCQRQSKKIKKFERKFKRIGKVNKKYNKFF